jgi:hypothetical protein
MKAPLAVFCAALFGSVVAPGHAAETTALRGYVANAGLIVRVEAEKGDAPAGQQPVAVKEVLKGVHLQPTLLLPAGSVKPGESALVLFPFKPPANMEPAISSIKTFRPPARIWPINKDRHMKTEGNLDVSLADVQAMIESTSPEEVGLSSQIAEALRDPKNFPTKDPQRVKYIAFIIALRDLNRAASAMPPRWPQAVPESLKATPDSFPKELIGALEKDDDAAFAKAFPAWLDSGVMRDRQCKFAEKLDKKLAQKCNITSLTEKSGYLPAAPRLPEDVLFDDKISAEERMRLLAQLAQFWNYDRFAAERTDAIAQVQAAEANSETVRRAAFWELHHDKVPITAGAAALRKIAGDPSPESARVLEAAYFSAADQETMGAARMAIKAKNKAFIDALLQHIEENPHVQSSQRAARQLCQEGVAEVAPFMLAWLTDESPEAREAGALNLCWLPRPESVPVLLKTIPGEKNKDVRSLMLVVLAQAGDKRGLEVLLAATGEKDVQPWAQIEIFRGLARCGDPQALPALAAAAVSLSKPGDKEEERVQLLAEAVNSFGCISKLYPAHEPDTLWKESGFYQPQVEKNLVAIKTWQKAQGAPSKK